MSGVATAIVGGSVVSGYFQSKGAEDAANIQAGASREGIAENRRQFDVLQKLFAPYVQQGAEAFGAQGALVGLGGPGAEQQAIQSVLNSPQYKSLTQQGEEALLQNAAATGGLRGGNLQGALAQYRPQILSQLLESRFNKLGQITSLGQASAAGQAAAGQNFAAQNANLYGQIGQAGAGAALAQNQAYANIANAGTQAIIGKSLGVF